MKQINIKNDVAAELLERAVKLTRQGKTETVTRALELYLKSLEADARADAAIRLVEERLHPLIESDLGEAPSKAEQEALLGF